MKRTRLHLIRHGEVEGAEEKRYNGQSDVELTAKGMAQYGLLQMRLQKLPIAAVYCSDLSRCVDGAKLLATGYELQPVEIPAMREIDAGDWQGLTWDEILKKQPKLWKQRFKDVVNVPFPNGENLLDVAGRIRPVVQELIERHQGEEIVVVAHGGVNRIIILDAIGAPLESLFALEQDFGCLNSVDYFADGNAVVRLLNG